MNRVYWSPNFWGALAPSAHPLATPLSYLLKLKHSDWKTNLVKDFFCKNKFSSNDSTQILTRHVIFKLCYNQIWQLKTTSIVKGPRKSKAKEYIMYHCLINILCLLWNIMERLFTIKVFFGLTVFVVILLGTKMSATAILNFLSSLVVHKINRK